MKQKQHLSPDLLGMSKKRLPPSSFEELQSSWSQLAPYLGVAGDTEAQYLFIAGFNIGHGFGSNTSKLLVASVDEAAKMLQGENYLHFLKKCLPPSAFEEAQNRWSRLASLLKENNHMDKQLLALAQQIFMVGFAVGYEARSKIKILSQEEYFKNPKGFLTDLLLWQP